jgi:hypothetical protein
MEGDADYSHPFVAEVENVSLHSHVMWCLDNEKTNPEVSEP